MPIDASAAGAGAEPTGLALWWGVPQVGLRCDDQGRWHLNQAAQAWFDAAAPMPQAWAALLHDLAEARGAQPTVQVLPTASGPMRWRCTPQAWGMQRLWWLQADTADEAAAAGRGDVAEGHLTASEMLALMQGHGRVGCLVRDLDTGQGCWDPQVFEIMGVPPADGTPDFARALALVHPEDRTMFLETHRAHTQRDGRFSVRFRVLRPSGEVRYLMSVAEVLAPRGELGRRLVSLLFDETDSVERYRAQREASDDISSMLRMAGVSVWRIDLANDRIEFNDQGYRMLGLVPRPDGMPLAEVRELVHPDDLTQVRAAAEEALRGRAVVDVMARYATASGGWRRLLTRRVARRDPDGAPRALLGVSLDLSELSHERDRALALMDRVRLATEAIGVGFWWRDLDGGVLEWDAQMFRLHHREPSEGTPTLDEFLHRHVHPLDRGLLEARQGRHISEWPEQSELTFRILSPEGTTRWIQSWTRRHWREGRRMSFGMHVDVTAEREAQRRAERERERDRFAIEAAGVGVWEVPLDGRPVFWSPSMFALFGLEPGCGVAPDELMARALEPAALAETQEGLRRCRREGRDFRVEHALRSPDGSTRWILSFGRLQCDASGTPLAVTGVAVDITGRRRAEELAQERDRAEQASLAKSALMARVSHELRTPMNAVLGFAELMALDQLSEPQAERLQRIRAAGSHLLHLIDDLLSLSRVDSTQAPMRLAPVEVADVLSEACQWVASLAHAGSVEVHAQPGLSSGAWVLSERRRLGQVLTNLLSNAIKYNHRGGAVWVQLQPALLGGAPAWQLTVEDSGRGMDGEQLAHLFEPFNRLGVEREGIPGTGIGLSIVRQLVEDMGGRLEVRSVPARGSAFAVLLPRAEAQPTAHPAHLAGPVSAGARAAGAVGAPVRVLYVEDNPVNELLVSEMLAQRPRFALSTAADGVQGLAAAQAGRPQIVLLDMQLPDCHGLELLARLRPLPALTGARFVALSANAMPDDIQAALAAGFDAYWTKPLDVGRFLAAMDEQADLLPPA